MELYNIPVSSPFANSVKRFLEYSGDLNADPSKAGNIQKPDFWR